MKIRQELVSNSSSTSFVVTMTDIAFKNALKDTNDFTRAVINAAGFEEGKLNDMKVITISVLEQDGSSHLDYIEISDSVQQDNTDGVREAFYKFIDSIPKDQKIVHNDNF